MQQLRHSGWEGRDPTRRRVALQPVHSTGCLCSLCRCLVLLSGDVQACGNLCVDTHTNTHTFLTFRPACPCSGPAGMCVRWAHKQQAYAGCMGGNSARSGHVKAVRTQAIGLQAACACKGSFIAHEQEARRQHVQMPKQALLHV